MHLRAGAFDGPTPGSIAEPFTVLAELQQEGLITHLGVSTVDAEQVAEAQSIAPIVSVQNFYNTPMALALAWLLQRSPNLLLIPGTSSLAHLHDNIAGAGLQLPPDAIEELNAIAG